MTENTNNPAFGAPNQAGPLFKMGDSVTLRSTLEMGRVERDPELEGGEYWYRVRFVKRVDNVVEDDLEAVGDIEETLESLATAGRWGRLQAVRCALGIERIQNTNRSTIYAFQSQRILFEPYQYKPLLKVLDSPDRRLLIADEVGLGKTIEAGLVLTELDARRTMERVLIVCPSRLRDKWRNELNGKFDQDFDILDKRSFLQAASRSEENPTRFRLRGIMSMQSMRGDEVREALTSQLGHVDMIVVDEAHHARNRQTATSELLRELCEVGDCVLLLTATPLHLKNEDLFTLVNALRPGEFRDAYVFDTQLDRHTPVHVASALARTQDSGRLGEISQLLKQVFCGTHDTDQHDPKAVQVIEDIEQSPPNSRREWVDIERQIQELHPLGSIVTRTRKRDVVENAPVRRARTRHLLCGFGGHRYAVLSLIGFRDLQKKIAAYGGDVAKGIEAFCTQNDGEGLTLPETLRLADYGLGHDDREPTSASPRVLRPPLLRLAACPNARRILEGMPPPRPQPAGSRRLPSPPRRTRRQIATATRTVREIQKENRTTEII